jgi:uncharacterized cupredoxin-like copper-binding protein
MSQRQLTRLVGFAAVAMVAVTACSGGSTPAPSTGGGGGDGTEVAVTLSEWSVALADSSVPAGDVTLKVTNTGANVHELIVVDTDTKAEALPVDGATVDEAGLTVVDEVEDVAAGGTATLALVDLAAGHYAVFCNVEGHYSQGMHADLTVE